jgi:hypothetical protein
MDTINDIKEVRNTFCGKSKCRRQATIKIIFPLGFSAGFCAECAEELIKDGVGVEKRHLNKEMKALELVEGPGANAIQNTKSSSQGVIQRK